MEKIGSLSGMNLNDYPTRVDNTNGKSNIEYNIGGVLANSGYNIGTEDSIGVELIELSAQIKSSEGVLEGGHTEQAAPMEEGVQQPQRLTAREKAEQKLQEMNDRKNREIEDIENMCKKFLDTGELPEGDVSPKLRKDLEAFLLSDTYSLSYLTNKIELENAGMDDATDNKVKLTSSKTNIDKYIKSEQDSFEKLQKARNELNKNAPDYQKKKNVLDLYEQILTARKQANKKLYNAVNHEQRDKNQQILNGVAGAVVGAIAEHHSGGNRVMEVANAITGNQNSIRGDDNNGDDMYGNGEPKDGGFDSYSSFEN